MYVRKQASRESGARTAGEADSDRGFSKASLRNQRLTGGPVWLGVIQVIQA